MGHGGGLRVLLRWVVVSSIAAASSALLASCEDGEVAVDTPTPVSPQGGPATAAVLTPAPGRPLRTPGPPPGYPTLTPKKVAQVEEIIRRDKTIIEAVSGHEYSVTEIGPRAVQSAQNPDEYILSGAIARVRLAEAVQEVDLDWPAAISRPFYYYWPSDLQAEYRPYRDHTQRFTVRNFKEIQQLWIDLDRKKVVEVLISSEGISEESGGQSVIYPAYTPDSVPGGEEAAREILGGNTQLQQMIAEHDGRITSIQSYVLGDRWFASVLVRWKQHDEIEADWPLMIDQDHESGDYTTRVVHFKTRGVDQLLVKVDLDERSVISIEPGQSD
jgi:hypothetical protein